MLAACLRNHFVYQEKASGADCLRLAVASNLDLALVVHYRRTLTWLVSLSTYFPPHRIGEFALRGTSLEDAFERRL
jgi:hypothetical protein